MRFYYADGSTFEGEWRDAPDWELQIVNFTDPTGHYVMRHGGDFYLMRDGYVTPIDIMSLIQWAVKSGMVKVGSMVDPEQWRAIYQRAKEDIKA